MTRIGQRWRPSPAMALAAVAGLALTGCATAEPEAGPPARAGAASAAGAMPTAQPVSTAQPARTASSAGADQAGTAGRAEPASPVSSASQPGCWQRSSFIIALVSDYHGWASPVEAARQFSRQGGNPSGYGTPTTAWTAGAVDESGVSVTAPGLTLHAVRLPNGRWAIDSGQRCV